MSTPLDEHINELQEMYTDDYELLADMKEAQRIIKVLRTRLNDTKLERNTYRERLKIIADAVGSREIYDND